MKLSRPVMMAIAGSVVAALLAAGCSSPSSGGGSASGSGQSGSSGAIKVMTITHINTQSSSFPETQTAALAAEKAINAAGGINGKQLSVTVCDDQYDPNLSLQCAHQAVEGGYSAIVGSYDVFPGVFSYLKQENFPYLFGAGEIPQEAQDPNSFPINAGQSIGSGVAAVASLVQAGAKKISFLTCSDPGCVEAQNNDIASLKTAGLSPLREVTAPTGGSDFTSVVTQAIAGADAVMVVSIPVDTVKLVKTLHQIGYKGLIGATAGQIGQTDISALGAQASAGLLIPGGFKSTNETSDPTISKFVSQMHAESPSAEIDELSLTTWSAYELFAELAKRLTSYQPSAILAAMKKLSTPLTALGDITAPYKVVGSTPPQGYPQLFNPTVAFNVVKNGQITTEKTGVNPWQVLAGQGTS